MRTRIFSIGLAVTAALTTFAADSANDARAVQGNWKPVVAELAGQPMPETVIKNISLKLDKGKYEVEGVARAPRQRNRRTRLLQAAPCGAVPGRIPLPLRAGPA